VTLYNVSFAYSKDHHVLQDFSLGTSWDPWALREGQAPGNALNLLTTSEPWSDPTGRH